MSLYKECTRTGKPSPYSSIGWLFMPTSEAESYHQAVHTWQLWPAALGRRENNKGKFV